MDQPRPAVFRVVRQPARVAGADAAGGRRTGAPARHAHVHDVGAHQGRHEGRLPPDGARAVQLQLLARRHHRLEDAHAAGPARLGCRECSDRSVAHPAGFFSCPDPPAYDFVFLIHYRLRSALLNTVN